MPDRPVEYSIILPVHNEEESLKPLFEEILHVMTPLNRPYEVIFVNDGSSDRSLEIIEGFRNHFPEVVRVINLSARSGQTYGLKRGLDAAKGEIAITLDADMQNDPADIPIMLKKMQEGYDCVCGWRKARQDTILKAGISKCGNIFQRLFTGVKIHDLSCTLRIYNRDCIDKIALNWEGQHRFIPLSLSLQGYRVGEVVSNHRLRKYGATKYSHKKMFRVVKDFFKLLKTKGRE